MMIRWGDGWVVKTVIVNRPVKTTETKKPKEESDQLPYDEL
jgi:hypothetical protein